MASLIIDVFLLVLLVLIAVMVVRTCKLYAVIVMSGAYSLTSAAIFVNLDAVDVAFTEAAVGAGISTILFLAVMAYVPADEKPGLNRNFLAGFICVGASPSACSTPLPHRKRKRAAHSERSDNSFGELPRI
jgi:multicomponent Na+:H+ antiporter subunit B